MADRAGEGTGADLRAATLGGAATTFFREGEIGAAIALGFDFLALRECDDFLAAGLGLEAVLALAFFEVLFFTVHPRRPKGD